MKQEVSVNSGGKSHQRSSSSQYSTFYISDRLYGIEVTEVQEIVRPMDMTWVPLAPNHVRGLINLRGQVATAIGVRELFSMDSETPEKFMNVVCNIEGQLISLQVDEIGDVVQADDKIFEPTPQTVPIDTRRFLSGVYKKENKLLSILDIHKIVKYLNNG